jgi:hypothetical protein
VGDCESGAAPANFARGLANLLVRLILDDPKVDGPVGSIWQPQFATQGLDKQLSRLRDFCADIPLLKVKPSVREA